jgi:TolA-binding protein
VIARSGRLRRALPRLLLGVLVAVSAPAGAGSSSPSAEYARAVTTAQMRAAELEQLLAETRDRVSQLEEVIRNQGQSEVDRADDLGTIRDEVTALRGRVEVLEFKLAEVKTAVEAMRIGNERRLLHAEARLRQLESAVGVKPPPPPTDAELGLSSAAPVPGTPAPAPTTAPAPGEVVPKDAAGRLDLAVEHMKAGRHGAARDVLAMAIRENVGASEMDEIRYRYAETFMNTGDYAVAVPEFQKVIQEFPKSAWACWSYYRQGECFDKLGKSGKVFYQGATEGACVKSDAAKEARKKL